MKTYVVRGSEDGNLAVCTSMKAAYRVANEYLEGSADLDIDRAEKALRTFHCVTLFSGFSGRYCSGVTIESFITED